MQSPAVTQSVFHLAAIKNIFTVPFPSHDLQEAVSPFCIKMKKKNQYTYSSRTNDYQSINMSFSCHLFYLGHIFVMNVYGM